MIVHFNKDHLTVSFQIDSDEDLVDAYQLEKLTQTAEWGTLLTSWARVREKYEEAIKKVRPSEVSFREIAVKAAAFNGFDECVSVVGKIIETAKKYREERKAEIQKELSSKKDVDYGTADLPA